MTRAGKTPHTEASVKVGPRDAPPDDPRVRGSKEHYDDPAYYDHAYRRRRDDVAYYRSLARKCGGPVLELGFGSGRVGVPIARDGVELVGLEASEAMLERGRERAKGLPPERLTLVHGDMREFSLGRRFPLVIAPFNALLHLYDPDDFVRCFEAVRRHLAPGGRFVFDVRVPDPEELARDPEQDFPGRPFVHPTLGVRVRYSERFRYDPIAQVQFVTITFRPERGRARQALLSQRQIFPSELRALLRLGGLRMVKRSGDFTGRPLEPGDVEMILETAAADDLT